ncbi:nitroreductase family protein [Candidatus Woesearchaeota archaeon]|nr:nitroreductase family protein [Candidatus Woesearchaeota archaeon]
MSDILDLIKSRRTIKEFQPKFVSWENISRVLDAGRHAPSCGNLQNWKFILVYNSDQKQSLAELCYGQYEIALAWILIVVCAEPEKAERYYGSRGRNLYTVQNCAAVTQNMLLEAHSLGLGTRWVGAFDEEGVRNLLNVPAEISIQSIVALGHAKDTPEKPPKFPLEPITYFSKWRSRIKDPAKYMNDIASILARKKDAAAGAVKQVISEGKELFKSDSKPDAKDESGEKDKTEKSEKKTEKEYIINY